METFEILIIIFSAFAVSILTFFSGFGLGTLMAPVFALFFPVDVAIALTGVVHLCNNLFKIALVGKDAVPGVLIRFGIPAVLAAFAGAWLLLKISDLHPLFRYSVGTKIFSVTPVNAIIAILLIFFALMEIIPFLQKISFGKNKLIIGGILSGFFGGLSGLQGALRSAFLIKTGLSKEAYIGTSVVIACFVDISRLSVYSTRFTKTGLINDLPLVLSATIAAISGAVIGKLLIKKITLKFIQKLVALLLIIISLALGSGLIGN